MIFQRKTETLMHGNNDYDQQELNYYQYETLSPQKKF